MMIVSLTQCYLVSSFAFEFTYNIGIYLCRGHVGMREHLRHGVDVGAGGYLQGGESVPEAMESDVLGDTCGCYPVFQIYRAEAFRHAFEHLPCATFSAQPQSLVTQRQGRFGLGLLRCQTQTPATVGSLADVLPTQGYNVTNA